MEWFSLGNFFYDKQQNMDVYAKLDLSFSESIYSVCYHRIVEMVMRRNLDLGVDFKKPWEQIEMEEYYQIEYMFCGQMQSGQGTLIEDEEIGVNIYQENTFGRREFDTNKVLNLTLIVSKE